MLKKAIDYDRIKKNERNTAMDCIFCAIVKGDIPSKKVYEDERCYAFLDINPMPPATFSPA